MEDPEYHVPSAVAAVVKDSLSPPSELGSAQMGAADKSKIHEMWRAKLEERWQAVILQASRGWPEAVRILEVVGADMKFKDPRTGRRLSIDRTSSALLSVLG